MGQSFFIANNYQTTNKQTDSLAMPVESCHRPECIHFLEVRRFKSDLHSITKKILSKAKEGKEATAAIGGRRGGGRAGGGEEEKRRMKERRCRKEGKEEVENRGTFLSKLKSKAAIAHRN